MKNKKLLIAAAVLIAVVLSGAAYFYIWGGEPEIENFTEASASYEILGDLALETYSELPDKDEYIILDINSGTLQYEDRELGLNEEQKKAAEVAGEKFDYLTVYEDAVLFNKDETGYYGLVYSEHPVRALYKAEIPQRNRDYHRINSHWYEWGVFGF